MTAPELDMEAAEAALTETVMAALRKAGGAGPNGTASGTVRLNAAARAAIEATRAHDAPAFARLVGAQLNIEEMQRGQLRRATAELDDLRGRIVDILAWLAESPEMGVGNITRRLQALL